MVPDEQQPDTSRPSSPFGDPPLPPPPSPPPFPFGHGGPFFAGGGFGGYPPHHPHRAETISLEHGNSRHGYPGPHPFFHGPPPHHHGREWFGPHGRGGRGGHRDGPGRHHPRSPPSPPPGPHRPEGHHHVPGTPPAPPPPPFPPIQREILNWVGSQVSNVAADVAASLFDQHPPRRGGPHRERGPPHHGDGPHGPHGPHRGGPGGHRGPHEHVIHPAVDIISNEETFTVFVDLPGLKKSDVDISVQSDRVLTISGEFKGPSPAHPGGGEGESSDEFVDVDEFADPGYSHLGGFPPPHRGGQGGSNGFVLKERRTGVFKRCLKLPGWVDLDGIAATMEDGVLKLVFVKGGAAPPRKVVIT